MREVFLTFLRLGVTSFGGPVAHLAYFRRTFVEQRRWLDEETYTRIVAFCSVLPGPTSSQVGMLTGLVRAGPLGAFLAWLGFTAPSAFAMGLIAALLTGTERAAGMPLWFAGLLDGLFAAAAGVVALAVVALARSICTDTPTRLIALAATVIALALTVHPGFQWVPIAFGALVGALSLKNVVSANGLPLRVPRVVAFVCALLVVAFVSITLVPHAGATVSLLATLVRAGTLVFGGGHVVLPLLQSLVRDGLIDERTFFAGYGAVQAMPGPLNTFATFIGYANVSPLNRLLGAVVATVLIFAPSFALIFAIAPVWNRIVAYPRAGGALRGASASVVGLLAAVLINPILISLVGSWGRIAIAVVAFAALLVLRIAPWIVVVLAAVAGALVRA